MKKITLVRPERKVKVEYVKQSVVTLDEVLNLVEQLSPSEQKELLARMSLATQTLQNGESRDTDMWSLSVYEALVASNGGDPRGLQGPALIKRLLGAPTAFGPIKDFMKSSKLSTLSVTERQSVYMMLAKLVVVRAKQVAQYQNIPLSVKLVANCATNITNLFDQSFPGYVKSGLVMVVARSLCKG